MASVVLLGTGASRTRTAPRIRPFWPLDRVASAACAFPAPRRSSWRKSRKEPKRMEVFEAIRTMQAVREYQDRPVPEDVLRRVLEAGRLTASGMNAQPWHFIVVQDPETLR